MSSITTIDYSTYSGIFTRGNKFFELGNHLGNVLVTVSDKKIGVDANTDGAIDYYTADIITATDYYPFGSQMPGRKYSQSNTAYRYGFNGKEKDPETYGEGNIYDYGFRIYNPRLGRFLSIDPLTKAYPWYTPYQYAGNKPIRYIDRDGLEEEEHSMVYNTYLTKASITNVIIRLTPGREKKLLKQEFAKAGITDETFINNYAVATKNRYGQTGLRYNISKQKITV